MHPAIFRFGSAKIKITVIAVSGEFGFSHANQKVHNEPVIFLREALR